MEHAVPAHHDGPALVDCGSPPLGPDRSSAPNGHGRVGCRIPLRRWMWRHRHSRHAQQGPVLLHVHVAVRVRQSRTATVRVATVWTACETQTNTSQKDYPFFILCLVQAKTAVRNWTEFSFIWWRMPYERYPTLENPILISPECLSFLPHFWQTSKFLCFHNPPPPYSPNLAPGDFCFPNWKFRWKGSDLIQLKTHRQIRRRFLTRSFKKESFQKWKHSWSRCVQLEGDSSQ